MHFVVRGMVFCWCDDDGDVGLSPGLSMPACTLTLEAGEAWLEGAGGEEMVWC